MGDNSKEGLDPSSRYYFHHSDTLATKLCLQLLDGGNWATWSKSVEIALSVKNKLGFVTGKIKKPSKSTDPDEFDLWERANHMLISWFSHSVSQDLVSSVLFAPTAQHIWEDFQARFAQGNLPRIFQIKSSIGSHVQGIMSVANYYTKLRGFWDELDSYRPFSTKRNAYHNENRLMQFLMGLNATYNLIRGQILLLKPVPDIREAYNMVTQDKKQRQIGNNSLTENFSVATAVRFPKASNPTTSSLVTRPFHLLLPILKDYFADIVKRIHILLKVVISCMDFQSGTHGMIPTLNQIMSPILNHQATVRNSKISNMVLDSILLLHMLHLPTVPCRLSQGFLLSSINN
ncbi:hypothetical protein RHGRI_031505 [Rhododendron griersonianum]|uniref:Retrotransposon Copia-like N-terminal domain-containing protein n=1 Tax=Rhododendron griersonianum TaxID=479676 RepID=A0AAV6I8I2_9ERIC|nr:hypothetical protein RHGRI_031505 [Rhododendron griersonianum]